jgi:hypothetical protein
MAEAAALDPWPGTGKEQTESGWEQLVGNAKEGRKDIRIIVDIWDEQNKRKRHYLSRGCRSARW